MASYTHGLAGELISKTTGDQTTTYTYDALGNLKRVASPAAPVVDYIVDGLGHRVGKKVAGALTKGFLWADTLRIAAETDAVGSVTSHFVYGNRPNVPEYMVRGADRFRLIMDHLGSVRLVVNVVDGSVAQRLDYDEFGVVTNDTNPGFQPFGFAGGLYDPDTKLVRFGVRDYDAEIGRWTRKDPLSFGGGTSNLYEYVHADPVNGSDPLGLADPGTLAIDFTIGLGLGVTAPVWLPAVATATAVTAVCGALFMSDVTSKDLQDNPTRPGKPENDNNPFNKKQYCAMYAEYVFGLCMSAYNDQNRCFFQAELVRTACMNKP